MKSIAKNTIKGGADGAGKKNAVSEIAEICPLCGSAMGKDGYCPTCGYHKE